MSKNFTSLRYMRNEKASMYASYKMVRLERVYLSDTSRQRMKPKDDLNITGM